MPPFAQFGDSEADIQRTSRTAHFMSTPADDSSKRRNLHGMELRQKGDSPNLAKTRAAMAIRAIRTDLLSYVTKRWLGDS